ncbi:NUC173-domain-containing protein [Tilletiaria anomala UBC 951]|uniref:NUC173-domain-containing protein n=1 Tax=Tilletiaria anomala (strain ATCC 24038 / CBS 436.72 / UBC 951) TaxID=1037660 RepID=A0A066VNL8_TILAU|nr:NUC173-domain-containing protein [Tilletiaria anomala UBC 951]KDN43086.1 NUC173-domain-containing protein [Tilletiaria anomala UBC 951]
MLACYKRNTHGKLGARCPPTQRLLVPEQPKMTSAPVVTTALGSASALQESLAKIRHHVSSKLENQRVPALLLQAVEDGLREHRQEEHKQRQDGEEAPAAAMHDDGASRHSSEFKPTEYFLAMTSMAEQATGAKAPSSLLPSLLYLLSLTVPHVPAAVLTSKLATLLQLVHRPLFNPHISAVLTAAAAASAPQTGAATQQEGLAAQLRSTLAILQTLLASLPRALLSKELGVLQAYNSTLRLCLDVRPKVRRRAQELVTATLKGSGSGDAHPYVSTTCTWLIASLEAISESSCAPSSSAAASSSSSANAAKVEYDKKAGKARNSQAAAALRQSAVQLQQQQQQQISTGAGIWVCGFAKELLPILSAQGTLSGKAGASVAKGKQGVAATSVVEKLLAALLRLPSLQNPFLSVASFDCFQALFRGNANADADASASASAPLLDSTIRALRAPKLKDAAYADVQLLPSYLRALASALVALSRRDATATVWSASSGGGDVDALEMFKDVMEKSLGMDVGGKSKEVRNAGRDMLIDVIRYVLPNDMVVASAEAAAAANGGGKGKSANGRDAVKDVVALLEEAFGAKALRYTHARAELLDVLVALISKCRVRVSSSVQVAQTQTAAQPRRPATAAELLLLPLVRIVATLRVAAGFEYREQADAVLGMAVEVCGPGVVLSLLPLGLLGENDDSVGRAWLLPLMRGRITNTELGHFVRHMVPLSEKLFERRVHAQEQLNATAGTNAVGPPVKKHSVEAKMYEALTEQVWALFPGYCDLPVDLASAFNKKFAELLANVLYSQPALRPSVFRGLQLLIERNTSLASSSAPADDMLTAFGLAQADGKVHLAHLASMAENLLAVFFNVFSQSPSDSRGYIADAITAYMDVLDKQQVTKTYGKLLGMLQSAIPQVTPKSEREAAMEESGNRAPPPAYTMMDLLVLLVPFLAKADVAQLFDTALGASLLGNKDPGIQKKAYRLLTRLVESKLASSALTAYIEDSDRAGKKASRLAVMLRRLGQATEHVTAGSKRDRIALLAALVPKIPSSELHFLPSIIPEAVLGTKEANQAARQSSYDLLVLMGEKMKAGGIIKAGLINSTDDDDGDDDDDPDNDENDEGMKDTGEEKAATLEEYITMVAAGLAGASPHMISATITAVSRLVYEYKEELSRDTLDEIVSTILVFLRSANREIVKSALGCVKVVIVGLEHNLLEKHLGELVPAMLGFSPANKQHFKGKVRHIFERLIRRFGYERIDALTDEDNKRLVQNIRKRKERARRKKAARADDSEEEEDGELGGASAAAAGRRATKNTGLDGFEDALYGSDSDVSASDDDGENDAAVASSGKQGGRKGKRGEQRKQQEQTYIMEDDDEPMDLLDRNAAAGHVFTRQQQQQRQQGKGRARKGGENFGFGTDAETGKLLLRDDEDDDDETKGKGAGSGNGKRGRGRANGMEVDGEDEEEDAGNAFLAKGRGIDGHTIGRGGVVKFHKNTKRMRADEEELAEILGGGDASADGRKGRKKQVQSKKAKTQIGAEFKAKRAQGDVVKHGVSPYAYVPLSQVSGKKQAKAAKGINITGHGKRRP